MKPFAANRRCQLVTACINTYHVHDVLVICIVIYSGSHARRQVWLGEKDRSVGTWGYDLDKVRGA